MKGRKDNKQVGYISINKSIENTWIWRNPDYFKWWIDILMTVAFTPTQFIIDGETVSIKKGQYMRSQGEWAKRWGKGKTTVNRFFSMLIRDQLITIETVHYRTILTVLVDENYDYNTLFNSAKRQSQKNNKNSEKHIKQERSISSLSDSYKEVRNGNPENVYELPNDLRNGFLDDNQQVTEECGTVSGTVSGTHKNNMLYEKVPKSPMADNSTTKQQENAEHFSPSESMSYKEVRNGLGENVYELPNDLRNCFLDDNQQVTEECGTVSGTVSGTPLKEYKETSIKLNEWGVSFFQGKILQIAKREQEGPPSFAPPPPYFLEDGLFGSFYEIDKCMNVFLSHDRMQHFRDVVFQSGPFQGDDQGADLVYRWAQAFNRFLDDHGETEKKCGQWGSAFVKWLGRMDRTQNPDEVSIFKSKNSNTNARPNTNTQERNSPARSSQKVAGFPVEKAREFLSRERRVPGDKPAS